MSWSALSKTEVWHHKIFLSPFSRSLRCFLFVAEIMGVFPANSCLSVTNCCGLYWKHCLAALTTAIKKMLWIGCIVFGFLSARASLDTEDLVFLLCQASACVCVGSGVFVCLFKATFTPLTRLWWRSVWSINLFMGVRRCPVFSISSLALSFLPGATPELAQTSLCWCCAAWLALPQPPRLGAPALQECFQPPCVSLCL